MSVQVLPSPTTRAPRPRVPLPSAPSGRRSSARALESVVRVALLLGAVVAGGYVLPLLVPDASSAATSYDSCAALRLVYPAGVATFEAVDGMTGARLPAIDDRTYDANARLDTDGDGIACE